MILAFFSTKHSVRSAFDFKERNGIHDVQQMEKVIPFIACVISCGSCVYKLVLGFNIVNLNSWIQIASVQQQINCISVGY